MDLGIRGKVALVTGAARSLGKADASALSVSDSADAVKAFNALPFNGDLVLTVDCARDDADKALIENVIATVGSVEDRSGKPGITREKVTEFFAAVSAQVQWLDAARADAATLPFGADTAAAYAAFTGVRAKVDDYFARCRLAAFDARAAAALNHDVKEY